MDSASQPRGIVRTVWEDSVVTYDEPVQPWQVRNTQECITQFGRKSLAQFNQLTLASQAVNTFKTP